MQGRKVFQEKDIINFRLKDYVPENNFYRRLDAAIDLSFLYKSTEQYYGKVGNPGIDPVVFFKLILTGCFENIESDHKIIENARLRLDILLFLGYNIGEELPWHSTISRTRKLFGEEVFHSLFKQVLWLCIEKGMVQGTTQSIDSVLIKANASLESLVDKKDYSQATSQSIDTGTGDKKEAGIKKLSAIKPRLSNETRYSTTDSDARVATKRGKTKQMNYLGQVSVDTAHHVITNIEAHLADKRDSECFEDVLTHTLDNLSLHHIQVKEVLADTNYSSTDALKAAEQKDITAYIPNFGQYKPERDGFTYDEEQDLYQCRKGAKLIFKGIKASHGTSQMKQYRSSGKDCKDCPLKEECIGKGPYKTIAHHVDKALYDKMHQRMQTSQARKKRRRRQSTVEPVIGTLTGTLAMKRINARGIKQASKIMLSSAIAYNLKKYLKWIKKKPLVAIALPKPEQNIIKIGQNSVVERFLPVFFTLP